MDLHRLVNDASGGLGAEQLGEGRLFDDRLLTRVLEPRRPVGQQARRV